MHTSTQRAIISQFQSTTFKMRAQHDVIGASAKEQPDFPLRPPQTPTSERTHLSPPCLPQKALRDSKFNEIVA